MSTESIANKLVALCRIGKYRQAQEELYADHAVSIEPEGSPWNNAEGLEALLAKIDIWEDIVEEVHNMEVSDPIVAGNFFSIRMFNDITFKGQGRVVGGEIGVYEVQDGKIVGEQFFYSMG
jgi:hypothetical protein